MAEENGLLVNPRFSKYLHTINSSLLKKLGEKVNDDVDYLDALFVFAGFEMAHFSMKGKTLPDSEIIRLVRVGEGVMLKAHEKGKK